MQGRESRKSRGTTLVPVSDTGALMWKRLAPWSGRGSRSSARRRMMPC